MKLICVLALHGIFIATVSATFAQTESDISKKYTALHVYNIRPGYLLYVDYDRDNNACSMTIERSDRDQESSDNGDFSDALANELIDELAPSVVRGKRLSPYYNSDSYIGGGQYMLITDYEYLSVIEIGHAIDTRKDTIHVLEIKWRHRICN